jgi:hypothetical protein
MLKRALWNAAWLCTGVVAAMSAGDCEAAKPGQPSDWERFYYYPYVYYPHNYQRYPESYDHLYYRYPAEKRIPVYNADWHNFYPSARPYHSGHHYILDIF